MTAGNIGNRHARLGGFLQHGQLLIDRVASTTLDPGQHLNSFDTIGHSRMTRLTPSPSLGSGVRSKWGLLQGAASGAPCIGTR